MNFWNGLVGCCILCCCLLSAEGEVFGMISDVVVMSVGRRVNLTWGILVITVFWCEDFGGFS